MDGRISNFNQIASVRRYTLSEGVEKGLDVIDCDNGKIRFLLNVNKACDVMQLYHEGTNVSFISKNGFTQREIGFLNRFEGGMIYTCGLDSVGGREGYELHGTLHNTTARILRAECDESGLVVEAIVRATALFGKNLTLKRKITSAVGSETLELVDTLINEGFVDENYCILYHINVGYPMLDDGAEVIADVAECKPRSAWAEANLASVYNMSASQMNCEEACYFLKMNKPTASLVNPKLGKKFTVSYSAETLPHFVEWKSMAAGDYALGLEPASTALDDGFEYKTIKPSEKIEFRISLSVEKTN